MAGESALVNSALLVQFTDRMRGFACMSGALIRDKEKASESGAMGRLDEIPTHYSIALGSQVQSS